MSTIEETRKRAERDATRNRIYLCPVQDLLKDLLKGLAENEERYGYPSCPCRIASGDLEKDRDIICPCDYRDPDVAEYGACYCTLYLNNDMAEKIHDGLRVPERRPLAKQRQVKSNETNDIGNSKTPGSSQLPETKLKLWYCKQCGYVAFREDAPYTCPICNAKRDKFSRILVQSNLLTV